MIDFVCAYWDSILIVLAVIALFVWLILRGKREIVGQMIYRIVTELEKEYGSGTGNLKLAAAIDELYPRLPAVIRVFATEAMIRRWIEEGLAAAKERWGKNAKLGQYITE